MIRNRTGYSWQWWSAAAAAAAAAADGATSIVTVLFLPRRKHEHRDTHEALVEKVFTLVSIKASESQESHWHPWQ